MDASRAIRPARSPSPATLTPSALTILAILLLLAPAARATSNQEYRDVVRQNADILIPAQFPDPAVWIAQGTRYAVIAQAASVQARLWQWTTDTDYRDGAIDFLQSILDDPPPADLTEFFAVYPLMDAYALLESGGATTPAFDSEFEAFVTARFPTSFEIDDHNRALCMATGLLAAAQRYPTAARAADWRAYAEAVWDSWYSEQKDITENAPNYYHFDLIHAWLLAGLLDREAQMHNLSVRLMHRRIRDQMSPAGVLPSYGDSGTPRHSTDWPLEHQLGGYASAFEKAAAVYDEGSFRTAAAQIIQVATTRQSITDRYQDIATLYYLSLAPGWMDETIPTVDRPADVALQTRRVEHGERVPDKMLLRAPSAEGEPFLLSDLYFEGHHSHENQRGAVNYLEAGGAQLQHILGYNNRNPEHAALFMLRPPGQQFPLRNPLYDIDRWESALLPTSRIPAEDPDNAPDTKRIDSITLRVEHNEAISLTVDNLRLTGPAGTLMVEDFESAAGWSSSGNLTTDKTEGATALRFDVGAGIQFISKAGYGLSFDDEDYTHIAFDWKLSALSSARPLILRINSSTDIQGDWHAITQHLDARLEDAWVARREGDSLGHQDWSGWFTHDSRLTRRMLLTREGYLLVLDQIEPGPNADGWQAGPIWHLPDTAAPQTGSHWFDSASANGRLLVWMQSEDSAADFGLQTADVWSRDDNRTVFGKTSLESGRPLRFISLLLPHASPPASIASGIATQWNPDMVELSVAHAGITMRLGPGREWLVRRHDETEADRYAWRRRLELTDASLSLDHFPMLLRLDDSLLPSDQPLGAGRSLDLRFADAFGNPLDFEVEEWQPGGTSSLWLRLPANHRAGDGIWLFWGNPLAPTRARDNGSVWTGHAERVFHLHWDLGDSAHPPTAHAANRGASDTEGIIGGAYHFDRDDYLRLDDTRLSAAAGSLSVWLRSEHDYSGSPGLIVYGRASGGTTGTGNGYGTHNEIHLSLRADGRLHFFIHGASPLNLTGPVANDGQWHHAAATWQAGATATLYLDGVPVASAPHLAGVFDCDLANYVGRPEADTRYYVGSLDELRLAEVPWTAKQIEAAYRSQSSDALFVRYGPTEANIATASSNWEAYSETSDTHRLDNKQAPPKP